MIVIAHRLSTIQNAGVCAATTCLKLNSQQYSVWLIFMCVCVCVCECGCVDIIAVVQNGTVTESGTHAQLVESSPFYSKAVGIHTLPHHRRVGSYRASFFRDASCAPCTSPCHSNLALHMCASAVHSIDWLDPLSFPLHFTVCMLQVQYQVKSDGPTDGASSCTIL